MAQTGAIAAYADYRDRARVEQRRQRPRLRHGLAAIGDLDRGGRGLRAHLHEDDARFASVREREARIPEDPDHRDVVGKDVGDEAADPDVAARSREVLEEQAAEAMTVLRVGDEEGGFGDVRLQALRGRQRDDGSADGGHEGGDGVSRPGDQVVDVRVGGIATDAEEAQAQALVPGSVVQGHQPVAVAGDHRPDRGDPPVGEKDVGGAGQGEVVAHGCSPNGTRATGQVACSTTVIATEPRSRWEAALAPG